MGKRACTETEILHRQYTECTHTLSDPLLQFLQSSLNDEAEGTEKSVRVVTSGQGRMLHWSYLGVVLDLALKLFGIVFVFASSFYIFCAPHTVRAPEVLLSR